MRPTTYDSMTEWDVVEEPSTKPTGCASHQAALLCSSVVAVLLLMTGIVVPMAFVTNSRREDDSSTSDIELVTEYGPTSPPVAQPVPDGNSLAACEDTAEGCDGDPEEVTSFSSCCPTSTYSGLLPYQSCRAYYACVNGQFNLPILLCPENELFDANTRQCRADLTSCEAIELDCEEAALNDPVREPTGSPTTSAPAAGPAPDTPDSTPAVVVDPSELCCDQGDEFRAYGEDCSQFYRCVDGQVVATAQPCPAGQAFDESLSVCNFAEQTVCQPRNCTSADDNADPVVVVVMDRCCPVGFTGKRSYNNCKEYYECDQGQLLNKTTTCAATTLFDVGRQRCFWEVNVICEVDACDEGGDPVVPDPEDEPPTAAPVASPMVTEAPAPTETPVAAPVETDAPVAVTEFPVAVATDSPVMGVEPTSAPAATVTDEKGIVVEDTRMIAYVQNWIECPTEEQLAQYSHIAVAFAISYVYNEAKNECDPECRIATPPICTGDRSDQIVNDLHDAGKKVILSFGGAGMGGSWDGDINDCWDTCFGREEQVVDRLVEIVAELDLDGVDIDYEYFYEDNQNGSTFGMGAEAQLFLRELTLGLREKLPTGSIVTHAPMDADMVAGTAYFELLKEISHSLDFLMPQYYNGVTRPVRDGFNNNGQGDMVTAEHYATILNEFFDGDATRLVMGFCIRDCGVTASNANAAQAADVMSDLGATHSCHGGAFFWVAGHDEDALWSKAVNKVMDPKRGCSGAPNYVDRQPTIGPTISPMPTEAPPEPTSVPEPCCPAGYTGYGTLLGCQLFYQCSDGSLLPGTQNCPTALLFDLALAQCVWDYELTTCEPLSC